ncbi:hypothetical protein VPH35_007499 [Triticum aestivum]
MSVTAKQARWRLPAYLHSTDASAPYWPLPLPRFLFPLRSSSSPPPASVPPARVSASAAADDGQPVHAASVPL